ncbi:hypothetical protein TNCV_302341 [Trichonephila clavipes]|nr:hypothetical protein TNCV_302341 [Trichonephila clavipes]
MPVGSGGLEVACPIRNSKVADSTPAGVYRFSGCESRRHARHMIMWHVKDLVSINLAQLEARFLHLSFSLSFERQVGVCQYDFARFDPNFEENTLEEQGLPFFSASTNLTRGLATRWLFRVLQCREGTINLQTSMPSPGFKSRPYGPQSSSLTSIPAG